MTVCFTALPGWEGTYFRHLKDSSATYRPKVFATTSVAAVPEPTTCTLLALGLLALLMGRRRK